MRVSCLRAARRTVIYYCHRLVLLFLKIFFMFEAVVYLHNPRTYFSSWWRTRGHTGSCRFYVFWIRNNARKIKNNKIGNNCAILRFLHCSNFSNTSANTYAGWVIVLFEELCNFFLAIRFDFAYKSWCRCLFKIRTTANKTFSRYSRLTFDWVVQIHSCLAFCQMCLVIRWIKAKLLPYMA